MSFVKRHPMVCFFVLTFALSWAPLPWGTFFAPGPLVAAVVIVLLTQGLKGLRALGSRLIRWRVRWVWYVLALGVPFAVNGLTAGLNMGLGAAAPEVNPLTPWYGIALAFALNAVNPLDGPWGEEPGYRGFALPWLQGHGRSPLAATAILAVLVPIWHLPLYFIPQFGLKPFQFITTVAVTFWLCWLFNRASGSVLIVVLAHAMEGSVRIRDLWPSGIDATRSLWINLAMWCLVAICVLVIDRRFWISKAPDHARIDEEEPQERPTVATA